MRIAAAFFAILAALVFARGVAFSASPGDSDQRWLVVSDIHLDLFASSVRPSDYASETNRSLFISALAQMKRAAPNPALVLLPGDFLMHRFAERVRRRGLRPDDAALQTMAWIASQFGQTFPKAQFALAIGNNDVPCGDYMSANGSSYLAKVARIWAPLVERSGAASDFAASFARGGYYATRILNARGLQLVALNTVPFSKEYRGNCGGSAAGTVAGQLSWLSKTLRGASPGTHSVVMMHIPPGFDALSTDFVHGFVAWPFLKQAYSAALVSALDSSKNHVAFAVAGHTHRFDFRLAGRVPVVVFGALSPIYGNNPTFYVLHVGPNGGLRNIDLHAFDENVGVWRKLQFFDRAWRVNGVNATSLRRVHARLERSATLRGSWSAQSGMWPVSDPNDDGTWAQSWRVSWCAQDLLLRDFARCADIRNRVLSLRILVVALVLIVVFLAGGALLRVRRST